MLVFGLFQKFQYGKITLCQNKVPNQLRLLIQLLRHLQQLNLQQLLQFILTFYLATSI